MTGFGDAQRQDERLSVAVEVRTVNNRYLRILTKCPDAYAALEGDIEKLVRAVINRGTVSVTIRVDRLDIDSAYVLNRNVLNQYWRQLCEFAEAVEDQRMENGLELPALFWIGERDPPHLRSIQAAVLIDDAVAP